MASLNSITVAVHQTLSWRTRMSLLITLSVAIFLCDNDDLKSDLRDTRNRIAIREDWKDRNGSLETP